VDSHELDELYQRAISSKSYDRKKLLPILYPATKDRGELIRREFATLLREYRRPTYDINDKLAENSLVNRLLSVFHDIVDFVEPVKNNPRIQSYVMRLKNPENFDQIISAMDHLLHEGMTLIAKQKKEANPNKNGYWLWLTKNGILTDSKQNRQDVSKPSSFQMRKYLMQMFMNKPVYHDDVKKDLGKKHRGSPQYYFDKYNAKLLEKGFMNKCIVNDVLSDGARYWRLNYDIKSGTGTSAQSKGQK